MTEMKQQYSLGYKLNKFKNYKFNCFYFIKRLNKFFLLIFGNLIPLSASSFRREMISKFTENI